MTTTYSEFWGRDISNPIARKTIVLQALEDRADRLADGDISMCHPDEDYGLLEIMIEDLRKAP